MRLYLDMCALKRPFDDPSDTRIMEEARAMLAIIQRIESGHDELVWSTALTLENEADPEPEPRIEVAKYALLAATASLSLSPEIESRARRLSAVGLGSLDAVHLAFAEAARCNVLVTCDDRFVRRARAAGALIRILNPIEYWGEVGDD